MNKMVLFSLFFMNCAAQKCPDVSHGEIWEMKKELTLAQKKLSQQKAYVDKLEEEIARHEIKQIKKEISQVNKCEVIKQSLSHDHWLTFFYEQRETLNHIIRQQPSCRMEAQEVLDQILTLITQLSEAYE